MCHRVTASIRSRTLILLATLLCLAGLVGCGGGGDGSGGGSDAQSYTVTATASAGGTISPASATVARGATATFTVAPDEGYLIGGVTGCGGSLAGSIYTTAPVTAPCQVSVSFRRPQLSGTIRPAGGTAVDSDVNDPLAPFTPNDNAVEAQPIPNPVTLGGYVNVAGAGPEGRSFATGDPVDVFRVSLLAGQQITLHIASDDIADDLDLYLVDEEENIVDASISEVARTESVLVPPGGTGDYFLWVHAFSGASNYLLNIGPAFEENQATMRLSDDFIPGEAVILLAEADDAKSGSPIGSILQGMAAERAQGTERRNMLIDLAEFRSARPQTTGVGLAERAWRDLAGPDRQLQARDSAITDKLATLLLIKELAHDPAIVHAAPNYLHELHFTFTPNDPRYPLQWHYPQINLPQAWPLSSGAGVVVAVIDSGVYLAHPDLEGRLVPGYDFVLGIPGGNDPGENPVPPGGSSYHGTHVAGTVAAATNNDLGVAGVAFNARVMPLRACGATSCSGFAIEQALRYAAGLPNASGTVPANPAQVINLSLGRGGPALASEQALYDELRARDILVVSSAGNNDDSTRSYPAAYRNVFAVSAVDFQRQKAYYSSFGSWVDVAAPGGDLRRDLSADGFPDGVLSTALDDRDGGSTPVYRFLQGTSMAAPHVAGVVALMRSAVPAVTAEDIENLLRNGMITDDLGAPGYDEVFGHGLINAYKAVTEAVNAGGVPVELDPFMVASPPVANFGTTFQSLTIVFSNTGGGTLEFGTPSENSGGWLDITAVESDDELVVTLSVEREGLDQGIYTATLTVPASANTVEVPVVMQVAQPLEARVGQQYVLLVTPDSFDVVRTVVAEIVGDGSQRFRFEDVPPGTYLLFTGSDANNDDFICDAGESCGAYRSPGDPVLVVVDDRDLAGLDFSSGYHLADPTATVTLEAGEGLILRKSSPVPMRGLPRSDDP